MVGINFRLTDVGRVEIAVEGSEPLETVLRRCSVECGVALDGIIAIRNGRVLQEGSLVMDGDEIDIFPAISGG